MKVFFVAKSYIELKTSLAEIQRSIKGLLFCPQFYLFFLNIYTGDLKIILAITFFTTGIVVGVTTEI